MRINIYKNPHIFLSASALSSIIYIFSPVASVFISIIIILYFFGITKGILISIILLLSFWIGSHAAFVTNINLNKKDPVYITTKGWFKLNNNIQIGEMIWTDFNTEVKFSPLPRFRYTVKDNSPVKTFKIPLITSILKSRIEKSNMIVFRSGGYAVSTPAHIFAVRNFIPDNLQDYYIITGLAHLLAMSGFHVGIFAAGLIFIFSFLPFKLRLIIIIPFLILLIPLSGFAVTVIRAVAFTSAYCFSVFADIKIRSINFLSFLAGMIILFSPGSLYSISFLLSFSAVYGILAIYNQKSNNIINIITIGVASTVFTLPLQLYFFGTANILSVFTTIILTPFVWLQMILGLMSMVIPDITIPPLIYLEQFIKIIMVNLTKVSWYFMYIAKPSAVFLIITFISGLIITCTRYKYFSLLILLIPLLPVYKSNILIFPSIPPATKGYILVNDNYSEIFYQGTKSAFVKNMIPACAETGIKIFDYGNIRIFDGDNNYIKIKNNSLSGKVCVNNENSLCEFVYYTRSNSIKTVSDDKKYIIYRNNIKHDNIYETNRGRIVFDIN